MRVALLSLIEATSSEPQGLRAYLPIGGRSIARHQLGLALAFGCARVVVLTEALTGEIMALQQMAEAGSARFHVIASQRALVPLVAPEDELFVFSDGLLAMPEDIRSLLDDGPAVLMLPAEDGVAAGFERIDINHAHAGAMRLPGRVVASLGELPADWHAASALLRLATQARIPRRELPASLLNDGRWRLIRNENEAQTAESGWLRLYTARANVRSPGEWLAATVVETVGPSLLHAGTRPLVIAVAGLVLIMLAIGAGWFGWRTPGFVLLGLASVLFGVAGMLDRIERDSLLSRGARIVNTVRLGLVLDAALVVLGAWRSDIPRAAGVPFGLAWFMPLLFVLLLHLTSRILPAGRWSWWIDDRLVIAWALAICSAVLPFDNVLGLGILGLVIAALVAVRQGTHSPNPGLTNRR